MKTLPQLKMDKKWQPGLLVMGTEPGCGKTVFLAGLAATLREQGFPASAMKPIVLGARRNADAELNFISTISHTPLGYHQVFLDRSSGSDELNLQTLVSQAHSVEQVTLTELPGGCSTPVSHDSSDTTTPAWRDATEIAVEFNLPCVLVSKHSSDAIERLIISHHYLVYHNVRVVGLATVETSANLGQELESRLRREDFAMALMTRTGAPYLGCIKYSASISVPRVNQGNLLRIASADLDILSLIKALNLTVPV